MLGPAVPFFFSRYMNDCKVGARRAFIPRAQRVPARVVPVRWNTHVRAACAGHHAQDHMLPRHFQRQYACACQPAGRSLKVAEGRHKVAKRS